LKRIIIVVGLVLGLVGIGAVAAHAGSGSSADACRDGQPASNPTTTENHDPTGRIAYELTDPGQGHTWLTLCASDSPYGTPSAVWGGHVWTHLDTTSPNAVGFQLVCVGDPAGVLTTNCSVAGAVDVTDPNPATPGNTVSATVTPGGGIGQTWAEVDAPVGTPNAPGGGDGTGGVVEIGPGTCVYADGTPTCPFVFPVTVGVVTVAEGDLPDVHTEPGCVNVNGTCQAPTVDGARVTLFGDTANDTVYVDTLVGGTSDEHSPTCVGVDDPCP